MAISREEWTGTGHVLLKIMSQRKMLGTTSVPCCQLILVNQVNRHGLWGMLVGTAFSASPMGFGDFTGTPACGPFRVVAQHPDGCQHQFLTITDGCVFLVSPLDELVAGVHLSLTGGSKPVRQQSQQRQLKRRCVFGLRL